MALNLLSAAEAAPNAASGILESLSNIAQMVEPWQLLIAAVILLVLALILIIALGSRNRKYDVLLDEKEQQDLTVKRMEREAEKAQEQNQIASTAAARDLEEKDTKIVGLEDQVGELTRFRDEYQAIPDARAEANRIIREAKDHAYVVSNRTEMEYAEIIEHANQEAESIRAVAQQRLARSHEALKTALARANEIVEEAHASASRISENAIAYMHAPSLIEAPAEPEVEAPEAPIEAAEPEVGDASQE